MSTKFYFLQLAHVLPARGCLLITSVSGQGLVIRSIQPKACSWSTSPYISPRPLSCLSTHVRLLDCTDNRDFVPISEQISHISDFALIKLVCHFCPYFSPTFLIEMENSSEFVIFIFPLEYKSCNFFLYNALILTFLKCSAANIGANNCLSSILSLDSFLLRPWFFLSLSLSVELHVLGLPGTFFSTSFSWVYPAFCSSLAILFVK